MSVTLDIGDRGADISPCGRYRYSLWRRWAHEKPAVLFVMLNPSTADADVDDPTIRKCIGFAKRWGYGSLFVWNLYALRATDPGELDKASDPIGHDNEDVLWRILQTERPERIVAAWGSKPNRGQYVNRELCIAAWGPLSPTTLDELSLPHTVALRLTKHGHPWHPLYMPYGVEPVIFAARPQDGEQ